MIQILYFYFYVLILVTLVIPETIYIEKKPKMRGRGAMGQWAIFRFIMN